MMEQVKKRGPIRRFFGAIGALLTWLRVVVLNLVFLLFVGMIVLTFQMAEPPTLPDEAVLVINPRGAVVEQPSFVDPLMQLFDPSSIPPETSLHDLVAVIRDAAKDDHIVAMQLDLNELDGIGISDASELSVAIKEFKETGKPVIATGDGFSQQQYLLASIANEIYVHSMGGVDIEGFAAFNNYFANALAKLNIDINVFRVGEFKLVFELFTRNDMSSEVREETSQWLGSLWQVYTQTVEANRELPAGAIDSYVNNLPDIYARVGGSSSLAALEYGLVDGVKSREEVVSYLQELSGSDDEGGYNHVELQQYLDYHRLPFGLEAEPEGDVIGVVVVEGPIVGGEQPPGVAGGDTIAGLLKQARLDDSIKGVLMRVDTGGGSAFASEVIREQVVALQAANKPVVVSMSGVAASGGYWIAAGADEIWAMPTTITGSIGIIALVPTADRALGKLGVFTDGVGTTDLAGSLRLDRPLNPKLGAVIQASLGNGYEHFIELVATGRGMEPADVDKIAQGKVWVGATAQELLLVDKLGGMDEALASIGAMTGLGEKPETYWLMDESWLESSLLDRFASGVMARLELANPALSLLGVMRDLPQIVQWNDPAHLYLQCGICQVSDGGF